MNMHFILRSTVPILMLALAACDGGSPTIPNLSVNCAQFKPNCCTSNGGPIIDPVTSLPPLECQQPTSEITRRNELALAEMSIRQAARSLDIATELSGDQNGIQPGEGSKALAIAMQNFIKLPKKKPEKAKKIDTSPLTSSENAALDSIAGRQKSLASTSSKLRAAFDKAKGQNEKSNDASFGLMPGALKKAGGIATNKGANRKKRGKKNKNPAIDFFEEEKKFSDANSKTASSETELSSTRDLASYKAPEDYFQRADTKIERSLFYRINIRFKKIALKWAIPSKQ